jgi:hypothetical protein
MGEGGIWDGGIAGGGRIGFQEMVVGRGRRDFGRGGCRRWKDWVAGDGCRKGKEGFWTGRLPEVEG